MSFMASTAWPCAAAIFALTSPTVSPASASICAGQRAARGKRDAGRTWKTFCCRVLIVNFMTGSL
jgi:hypothetical protein